MAAVRLRTSTLLVALAMLAAGCVAETARPGDALDVGAIPGDGRVPVEDWKERLSTPVYDGIVSTVVQLEAADGTPLALTFHLPAGLAKGAQVPTLLQITPYQPLDAITALPRGASMPPGWSWSFFIERGIAYVAADARGTGASGGCLDFGGAIDRADAKLFVDWIREQPWSDGRVLTDGVSHPGMGSLVAYVADADLVGALAHAPVVSYYADEWYQGAKFENQFNGPLYQAIELLPPPYVQDPAGALAQAATCTGRTTVDFEQPDGRFGPLWQERDLSRHLDQARAPVLLTQGFVDLNVQADHVQMYWDALPDDFPKSVIWGWWYHGWPDMDGHPAGDFASIRHRWIDHHLLGLDNGLDAEPRVLVEDSTGVWHEGRSWPLEPSVAVTLRPAPDGSLVEGFPEEGAVTYRDEAGARRGAWEGASAVFRTEPLEAARLVNGAPIVELSASSTVDATKWVVYLVDEAPDGSWQRITHGYADSHTHGDESAWHAMEPGKTYAWTIRLLPTAVVVEEGHRIALVIASQDSALVEDAAEPVMPAPCWDDHRGGCYAPSGIRPAETVGRAENTIHVGPGGTSVRLHWVDPALTAKPPAA